MTAMVDHNNSISMLDGSGMLGGLEKQDSVRFSQSNFLYHHKTDEPIESHYTIGELLGEGGFGIVFKGVHKVSKAERAIKRMDKDPRDKAMDEEIIREFEFLKELDHPNLIKVYDMFEDKPNFHIVTDLYGGGDLIDYLEDAVHLPENKVQVFMNKLLSCIEYLHDRRHMVHRDLKLENILLDSDKNLQDLKLIDFGLAQHFKSPKDTFSDLVGSTAYVAPQVIEGEYTAKCDIWSCGVIAYCLMAGYTPFEGMNDGETLQTILIGKVDFVDKVWDPVSQDAKDFICNLLAYEEAERPTAAQALAHPWLKQFRANAMDESTQDMDASLRESMRGLRRFTSKGMKLKQAACAIMASQMLQKEEKEDINNDFRFLNRSLGGSITCEDLQQALKELNMDAGQHAVDAIMEQVNFSGSGAISYSEFTIAMMFERDMVDDKRLQMVFERMDKDKDGRISAEDLKGVLQISIETCNKMLKPLKCDSNGKLTFDEFSNAMMSDESMDDSTSAFNNSFSVMLEGVTGRTRAGPSDFATVIEEELDDLSGHVRNEEAERLRLQKEEEERIQKEEERLKKEEEARLKKLEEERLKKEALKKAEEEKRKAELAKRKEEARLKKEAEKKRKEEEKRLKKEAERQRKEEEKRLKAEEKDAKKRQKEEEERLEAERLEKERLEEEALEKKRIAFMWYMRFGYPDKKKMISRVVKMGDACPLTEADVEALPWMCGGAMIPVKEINKVNAANVSEETGDVIVSKRPSMMKVPSAEEGEEKEAEEEEEKEEEEEEEASESEEEEEEEEEEEPEEEEPEVVAEPEKPAEEEKPKQVEAKVAAAQSKFVKPSQIKKAEAAGAAPSLFKKPSEVKAAAARRTGGSVKDRYTAAVGEPSKPKPLRTARNKSGIKVSSALVGSMIDALTTEKAIDAKHSASGKRETVRSTRRARVRKMATIFSGKKKAPDFDWATVKNKTLKIASVEERKKIKPEFDWTCIAQMYPAEPEPEPEPEPQPEPEPEPKKEEIEESEHDGGDNFEMDDSIMMAGSEKGGSDRRPDTSDRSSKMSASEPGHSTRRPSTHVWLPGAKSAETAGMKFPKNARRLSTGAGGTPARAGSGPKASTRRTGTKAADKRRVSSKE